MEVKPIHHAAEDPHGDQPRLTAGPPPEEAAATLLLLHGRGGTAETIMTVHRRLRVPGIAAIAPQAAENHWYPRPFQSPLEENRAWLESALARVDALIAELGVRGVPPVRIALLGFSQGACLTCEYVVRNPRRYGAIMPLTGGLLGPPGTEYEVAGSLAGTPVFMGTSDPDALVPLARVEETARVLEGMGARVELRRYAGMEHTINEDELAACRELLRGI